MKPIEKRVVFLQGKNPKTKLLRLVETAKAHFLRKEHFSIFVEDEKAQTFVDEFLWKFPDTSFLPHVVTSEETTDWIVITKEKRNLNRAKAAFNLCPTPLLIDGPFQIIYDFEDLTSLNRKNLSALRFDAYKKASLLIEARLS